MPFGGDARNQTSDPPSNSFPEHGDRLRREQGLKRLPETRMVRRIGRENVGTGIRRHILGVEYAHPPPFVVARKDVAVTGYGFDIVKARHSPEAGPSGFSIPEDGIVVPQIFETFILIRSGMKVGILQVDLAMLV